MSTRFYAGQQDYIIQLNLMDDEFDAAVASVSGKANSNNGVFTGTTTLSNLYINRINTVASGIQWYNSASNPWQEYMAQGAATSQGPKGNITAPTGTLVTGWALRSVVESSAGNGWTWETNTSAGTTPTIVAEINSAGAAKFAGAVTAASFSGNASSATYATNSTITNDTTTNATMYLTWVTATSGNIPSKVSSTKLTFNPSTGMLTSTGFTGALTGNATSSTTTAITNDDTTAVAVYPMWTTANTGNLAAKVSSNSFTFVPSTGALTLSGTLPTITLNRSSAVNSEIAFQTTSGTVFAGQGPANTFAVGGTSDLNGTNWFRVNATDATLGGNLIVGGNLTVNGTTTTVNSTTVTIDDPILTLGGDTAPTSDDNKDRGIEYRWHNGTVAKLGFFGLDDSTGKFIFIPDATNTGEVYTGTKGTIDADLTGNVTGALTGNASTATTLQTSRTITLTGDVTGSVGFNGSANVSITATVVDDSHNHTISTVTGLQAALDAKADNTGGVIGNQATGWAAVNAPTTRIVDTNTSATAGGLAIESYRPTLQFIDRSASERSVRVDVANGTVGLWADDGTTLGAYTNGPGIYMQPHTGAVTIGGSHSNNVGMYVRTPFVSGITTSTSQYGVYQTVEFNESCTASGYGILSQPRVKDAVFTLTNMYGFIAAVPTVGAQATVTNYHAFIANNPTSTHTLSIAYRGQFASATGKWNLYMDGSASNYINGKLLVGSTSDTGEKFQVTGTAKFTGSVTIPTEAVGDNSTKAASTAFAQQAAADAAIVYSIVFG